MPVRRIPAYPDVCRRTPTSPAAPDESYATDTGTGAGYATENFSHSISESPGHPTGAQQMSTLPRHGAAQSAEQVFEGATGTNLVGLNSGTTNDPEHNTRIGGGGGGYGTGGSYT